MDSSTLHRSTDKLDMIKTSSRIDSKLMNRIGEPVMTGNRCSAPSPCRAFTSVVPSYHMAEEIRKHQQRNLTSTKNDNQATEVYQPMTASSHDISKRIRLNDNAQYEVTHTGGVPNNEKSSISGFINGFIVKTNEKADQSPFPHNDVSRNGEIHGRKRCKERRKEYVNRNSNNNRVSPTSSPEKSKLTADSERIKTHDEATTNDYNSKASKYLEKQRQLEKYRHSHDVNVNEEKNLNGSDILKRMYESFGSNGGAASRLAQASGHAVATKPFHSSSRQTPICCSSGETNCHCSSVKSAECDSSKIHHSHNSATGNSSPTLSDSLAVSARNLNEDRLYVSKESHIYHERASSIKYDHETKQNFDEEVLKTTKRSPVHSIDSLLSDRQKVIKDSYRHRQTREDVTDEHLSRHFPTNHSVRQPESSPHSDTGQQNRAPSSNSENDETYNEKSREIFRRDKEIIENSIRQNSHLEHFNNSTQENHLAFPQWLNANALAAFQANLLASIPQNAQALNAVSLAAAASANPMLLGMNPCLANPYLLSTLTGGDATIAAYQQAMAQGLLQNYSAIKAAASGGQAIYPGSMHNFYGNIPFQGSPAAISSALAASIPHTPGGLYPNPQFPYIPFPPQNNGNEKFRTDIEPKSRCRSNSPRTLPPPANTIEKMSSIDNEPVSRKHLLSDDNVPYKSIPPPKRHFAERAIQRTTVPHPSQKHRNSKDNIFSAKTHIKNKNLPSSKFATKLKRKSPISDKIIQAKKRHLNTVQSSDHTKMNANDFSPTALLTPSSSNEDDTGIISQTGKSASVVTDKGTPCRNTSYKNLTRERRLVANARERTRVHTISSAFEELRQQIPSYSCSQKLSKLAILRIACSYIQSLSVLSGRSSDGTFKESVDQCTRVLQAESRARSRRKSNKAQIEWEVANYEKTPPAFEDDTQRQSLETQPPVAERETAVKSLSRESVAQVHDERVYRSADDSPPHNEFSRDSYPVNTTRFETFNESCNQSNDNVTEDIASTADNNSLDAISGKINRSPVNDMDGDTWTSKTRTPAGDNVSIMSTWRCDDKVDTETCNIRRDHHGTPSESSDDDTAINEDQQIDIINVED